jgi:hypothetical protein
LVRWIRNRRDFASSLTLLLIGLFLVSQSRKYSVWGRTGPEAGFFPLVVGIIILGLSLILFIETIGWSRVKGRGIASTSKAGDKAAPNFLRAACYAVLTLLYALFIAKVGFLIATFLFLFLILKYGERQGWRTTVLLGTIVTLASYLLFRSWLGVPLPLGFMKGWW